MRDLYKTFLKMKIMPSVVDQQDPNKLMWVMMALSADEDDEAGDEAYMGLF